MVVRSGSGFHWNTESCGHTPTGIEVGSLKAVPGAAELSAWLASPMPAEKFRSELAVRLRGASYGDRAAVLDTVRRQRADHATRLDHYERLCARDFPAPSTLTDQQLDVYLVLRGGIRLEQFWVDWLTEYLDAHESPARRTTEGQSR